MNKIDFLNAITGKPVQVTIDGIEVEIRSLTVLETQELQGKTEIEAALGMVVAAFQKMYRHCTDRQEIRNTILKF